LGAALGKGAARRAWQHQKDSAQCGWKKLHQNTLSGVVLCTTLLAIAFLKTPRCIESKVAAAVLDRSLRSTPFLASTVCKNALFITIHRLDAEELCCLSQFLFDPQ
jgi:hypothetical protein